MSRVEENRIWIESIPSRLTGNLEDVSRKIEAYKLQALIDISKSLAIIASDKDIAIEADAYVRDHMLIEFIISCIQSGTPCDIEIEEWHDAWQKKIEELEAKHDD